MITSALHSCDKGAKPLRPFVVILGEKRMIQYAHNMMEIITNLTKTKYADTVVMVRPATEGEAAQPELI